MARRRGPDRRAPWCGGWLLAAGWAGAFPLVSGLGPHRLWGLCATAGYLAAATAVLALPGRRGRTASVALALAGALVLPLLALVLTGQGQSEVGVIERSGAQLLHHGTPYLAEPRTVQEYTPYLPGMALFGLPRALLGADGWVVRLLGDARLWCAAAFLGCLLPTARRTPGLAALIASPLVALPLCVSGVDLPLTGLCCLALALAAPAGGRLHPGGRRAARGRLRDAAAGARPGAAGLALAAACALKWTAWPAVAVVAALLAATAGRRAAVRCASVALAGTAALVLPGALRSPGPLLEQVFAFPTGRGGLPTPAGSPLPGRLLAQLGPGGWYLAVALLLLAGLAVAASLLLRPPRDAVAAADRLALGLCLAFLLAPAGRFGYLALPLVLVLHARSRAHRPDPATHLHPAGPATHLHPAGPADQVHPADPADQVHPADPRTEAEPTPWVPRSSSPTTSRPARAA
ncbi:hypothetical protein ACFVVX_31705 [Kitasatospora sp. NPDC058170]|uniref:hypothetical protein n=1 Tax=Kitasatospora sp. NPDC058170 TaxID=3346364 RepID=UPI0036DDEFD8